MANYDNRSGMGSFMAGLVGAVVGAIGVATVILLSDKENRKKVQEKVHQAREKGEQVLSDLRKRGEEVVSKLEKQADGDKQSVEQKISRRKK